MTQRDLRALVSWMAATLSLLAAPASAAELDLVYSGGLRGFSRASGRFELQDRLQPALDAAGRTVTHVHIVHGLLARGDLEMSTLDGSIEGVLTFARSEDKQCDDGVLVQTWRTPTERFVPLQSADGTLAPALPVLDATLENRRLHRCTGGDVIVAAFIEPNAPPPDARSYDVYALRTAYRWVTAEGDYMQLGLPRREPGRRLGVIREALATTEGARLVDSGDFMEPGQDSGDEELALSRQLGFDVLQALDPLALAPGAAELGRGVETLVADAEEHGLPYVATNWQRDDGGEPWFPTVLRRKVPDGDELVDVAFLGVTDPTMASRLPPELLAGVTLLDPVPAVQDHVDALLASVDRPDAIVLLVNPTTELQRRLRSALYGIDLLLGDPTAATFRVDATTVTFRNVGDAYKAAPVTLPLDGIAAATLRVQDGAATSVTVRPLEVSASAPSDPDLTATLTDLQVRRDLDRQSVLIPPDDPLTGVTEERWEKLVCEAVMERTGADAVFIDKLAPHRPSPGGLTEVQVADRLRGGHVLEVHRVEGSDFVEMLRSADPVKDIHCGAATNTLFPVVHGQFVNPSRTYRVATTNTTRRGPLGAALSRTSSLMLGEQPTFREVRDAEGSLTLERAVLETLRQAGTREGWVDAWMTRSPRQWRPLLLLNIRRLGVHVTRFQGAGTSLYEAVPESLLHAPSSFTLGGNADIALEFSSASALTDLRFQASYTRFVIDGLPAQEIADDWILSTSVELPIAGTPYARWFQARPFVQVSLDSEFTPFSREDGTSFPRQLDLSAFGGVSFAPGPWLRSFRIGGFLNRDMGRLDDKGTEYGARWSGATFHIFKPRAFLIVRTAWDVQVFGNTPLDDAADLRLRMWGEVNAAVRIWRALRFGLFAQGLLAQGRVAETAAPAGSLTFGASFELSAALRLDARPRLFP